MIRIPLLGFLLLAGGSVAAQLHWQNVDSLYGPLPPSVHVFQTTDPVDGQPNVAFYVVADLNDRGLAFTTDTTYGRRLTPQEFYARNGQPLVVVNTTFFSFATNQNLNLVVKDGRLVSFNRHTLAGRGRDTLTYRHPLGSALGISKRRKPDVAWLYTDSSQKHPYQVQVPMAPLTDSLENPTWRYVKRQFMDSLAQKGGVVGPKLRKWKMQTAVGGGPVLLQNGEVRVTNNEELKFGGKAMDDRHPRTAMGYTQDNKLIILTVQGRSPGIADGVSLSQQARILKELGCVEALNLDGGGSSCLLVNGKETITPSDKGKQRAVPAVFIIQSR